MPDTTNRPTPDELAEWWGSASASNFLAILRGNGYVIAHPDDVPIKDRTGLEAYPEEDSLRMGWNDCRAHIFGDG